MSNKQKVFSLVGVLVLIIIVIQAWIIYKLIHEDNTAKELESIEVNQPKGQIVYRRENYISGDLEYFLMDGYGNNLRYHSLSDQNWGGDIMHDSVAGDVGIAPSPATV